MFLETFTQMTDLQQTSPSNHDTWDQVLEKFNPDNRLLGTRLSVSQDTWDQALEKFNPDNRVQNIKCKKPWEVNMNRPLSYFR